MAPLLQDIGRLLRGETRHFTEHHDQVVNELWPRLQLLPQGYFQELFKQLFAASSVLVETLVGMNSGKRSSFAVDCRTINADGYRRLYFTLLAYFVFQLMLINPPMRDMYLCALTLFCGASNDQRALLARLRRAQTSKNILGSDMGANEVWKALMQILKPGERLDPLGAYTELMLPALASLKAILQRVNQQPEIHPPLSQVAEEEMDRLAEHFQALLADFGIEKRSL